MRVFLPDSSRAPNPGLIALVLRAGLGSVILVGGLAKLLQLLDPGRQEAFVQRYLSPDGYVNQFFASYLFEGTLAGVLSPWTFLTALSAFEFLCGILLMAGFLVRPQALVWGLLFWSFVAALPVVTASGVEIGVATHHTPALLVLIRDIGLSGMFFVLFNVGSGRYSLDERLFGPSATRSTLPWDNLGLLLRVSVALPLLVGAAFAGYGHIQTFRVPAVVLVAVALPLLLNVGARVAGAAVVAIMLWFFIQGFDPDQALIATLNGVKRELAFVAGGLILAVAGGGERFSVTAGRHGLANLVRPGKTSPAVDVA